MAGSSPAGRAKNVRVFVFVEYLKLYGGRSSAGRAPDCDSGCRGFDPRRSPLGFSSVTLSWAASSVGRADDS